MRLIIKDTVKDLRRMFLDWRLDCSRSDDLQAMKRILVFLLKRLKVGGKQLFGTGLGVILILVLLFEFIPHPSFSGEGEKAEVRVESVEEQNSVITTKAKAPKPREKNPVDWDMVIGFVFAIVVINLTVALTFWRKDRKKLTPEMIKKRLTDEDAKHRERRRNILFDLFRTQGLDLRAVKNRNQLADDIAEEVSDDNLENDDNGGG